MAADEAACFNRPWRDGRHAVRLIETLGISAGGTPLPPAVAAIAAFDHSTVIGDYELLDQFAGEASFLATPPNSVTHAAAAWTLSNWIANSHGGGHVPNVHLRSVCGWLLYRSVIDADVVRWEIGRARARDGRLIGGAEGTFLRAWRDRDYVTAWRVCDA